MIDYITFMQRIQQRIRETGSADGIQENTWRDVVLKELNEISIECTKQLQNEPGSPKYSKPSGVQPYETMPPPRLLALAVSIVSWLGWVSHQKKGDIYNGGKPMTLLNE
jgi:hypothetical protein